MEIKRRFLNKYLHQIAIDQIFEEYTQKGYVVHKDQRLGKYETDLVARNDKETIVIEVKAGRLTPERKKAIAQLSEYVRNQHGYRFLVVVASEPKQKRISIDDLSELIFGHILNEFPNELSELATHVRPEQISDVEINAIQLKGAWIFVSGNGVVSVELQYGSDGDQVRGDGIKLHDSFPFEFEFTLTYDNGRLTIDEVDRLEVDNSSFFGDDED